jgi:hypothetical protein
MEQHGFARIADDTLRILLLHAGPQGSATFGSLCRLTRDRLSEVEDRVFRSFSVRRWGVHVLDDDDEDKVGAAASSASASSSPPFSWRSYYAHRSSTWVCPASPQGLFQEDVGSDPWKLIASCVLSSRTSGGPAVREAVAAFFEAYPTPSAVLEADPIELEALLFPLGLHRERIIPRTATGFLSRAWTGQGAAALFGCGKFVEDSWRTFCLGEYARVARDTKSDANVRAYASWCVRMEKRLGAGAGAGAGARPRAAAAAAASSSAAPAAEVDEDDQVDEEEEVVGRRRMGTKGSSAASASSSSAAARTPAKRKRAAQEEEGDEEEDASKVAKPSRKARKTTAAKEEETAEAEAEASSSRRVGGGGGGKGRRTTK